MGGTCRVRLHAEHHLAVIAHVDTGEVRILGAPLGEVLTIGVVAIEEMVFAEVNEDV